MKTFSPTSATPGKMSDIMTNMLTVLNVYLPCHVRGSLEPAVKAIMEASRDSLHTLSITECNLMTTERFVQSKDVEH